MSKGLPRSMSRGAALRQEIIKLVFPIKNLAIDVTSVSTAVGFGSAVIGGLPVGNLVFLGSVAYLKLTTADADGATAWHGDFGVGTAPTADADLGDAEDDNIIPSTTIDAVAATKISLVTRGASTQTENGAIIDNTDGSKELNLNVLIDAADIADDAVVSMTADGVLHVLLAVLGTD